MVGRYQRKTERQSWSQETLKTAIAAVNNGEMGWLKCSKIHKIPQATLRRYAKNANENKDLNKKALGAYKPVFTGDEEKKLVEHLKNLEAHFFGLTSRETRDLAFEWAKRLGRENCFGSNKTTNGREWLRGFQKRHPDLSLRRPQATSLARAECFNNVLVGQFFNHFERITDKVNFEPHQIWNVDESGLSSVQKPPKVFASKGKKQISAILSAEKGRHITTVCCMSASGGFIPPALIFCRKNRKDELTDKAPPRTLQLVSDKGWMNGPLFLDWMKHFVKHTKANKDSNPMLLFLDGHSSHKDIAVLEYAKENGVHIVCFPPHCTHHMQPLDRSFFGPLKSYYNDEVTRWMRRHPGRVITDYQISELFAAAYVKSAMVGNTQSGYECTGLYPFNRNIFPDHMCKPAYTTDRQDEELPEDSPETPPTNTQVPVLSNKNNAQTSPLSDNNNTETSPLSNNNDIQVSPASFGIEPLINQPAVEDIILIPKCSKENQVRKSRKREVSAFLTSSPYMLGKRLKFKQLIEKEAEKKRKTVKKKKKSPMKNAKNDKENEK